MNGPEFTLVSVRLPGAEQVLEGIDTSGGVIVLRWRSFMLETPVPADEVEDRLDLEAAERALAESDERIPYDQVRRERGLS